MKKTLIFMGLALFMASCGDGVTAEDGTTVNADCSCDEVQKKDGKFYQTGTFKKGERVTFGDLFTGTCATLNGAGEVLETGEFNNGYMLSKREWLEVDGKLYQTLDMVYENNRQKDGFKMKLESQHGYLYPIEYNKYKNRQDIAHYSMANGYGKTVISGDLGNGFFESKCKMEGYDISESEMGNFLKCLEKENLPKFFYKKR